MNVLCVIPSRIGSTRLPRKALLPIQGKPMVQWVHEKASQCEAITKVIVATDSEEIAAIIENIGGNVMLTPEDVPTGSDRVALVASHYPDMDVVINLQGDEPFISPNMLTELLAPYLAGEKPDMATLAYPLDFETDYVSPAFVKVIINKLNNALYFSRSPIPHFRSEKFDAPVFHHVGVYAFRYDFLMTYTQLPRTLLEEAEGLEQLRALEHGREIRVCITAHRTLEINTHAEYEQAQSFICPA